MNRIDRHADFTARERKEECFRSSAKNLDVSSTRPSTLCPATQMSGEALREQRSVVSR